MAGDFVRFRAPFSLPLGELTVLFPQSCG